MDINNDNSSMMQLEEFIVSTELRNDNDIGESDLKHLNTNFLKIVMHDSDDVFLSNLCSAASERLQTICRCLNLKTHVYKEHGLDTVRIQRSKKWTLNEAVANAKQRLNDYQLKNAATHMDKIYESCKFSGQEQLQCEICNRIDITDKLFIHQQSGGGPLCQACIDKDKKLFSKCWAPLTELK